MKRKIKIRRTWGFNPVTRVKSSKRGYSRAQSKRIESLEARVVELEKHSHPPVNLRPAVEQILKDFHDTD